MYQDEMFREHFWQPKQETMNNEEALRDTFWQTKVEANNSQSQSTNREKEETNKGIVKTNPTADYSLRDKRGSNIRMVSDDDDEDEDDEGRDRMHKGRIGKKIRKMDDGNEQCFVFHKSEKIYRW